MGIFIGLTGPNASGKGEAASFLREQGFQYHSLSDVVRREATRVGRPHDRETLIEIGNRLRTSGGYGVLAKRILPVLSGRDVIDSIRHPAEISVLRTLDRFFLLGIDAPVELRFRRARSRGRIGEVLTLEDFIELESKEKAEAGTEAQQLNECLRLAEATVRNDSSLETFRKRIREVLARASVL